MSPAQCLGYDELLRAHCNIPHHPPPTIKLSVLITSTKIKPNPDQVLEFMITHSLSKPSFTSTWTLTCRLCIPNAKQQEGWPDHWQAQPPSKQPLTKNSREEVLEWGKETRSRSILPNPTAQTLVWVSHIAGTQNTRYDAIG
jgi:hypothetical protein